LSGCFVRESYGHIAHANNKATGCGNEFYQALSKSDDPEGAPRAEIRQARNKPVDIIARDLEHHFLNELARKKSGPEVCKEELTRLANRPEALRAGMMSALSDNMTWVREMRTWWGLPETSGREMQKE